jgi:hypothetical protein
MLVINKESPFFLREVAEGLKVNDRKGSKSLIPRETALSYPRLHNSCMFGHQKAIKF